MLRKLPFKRRLTFIILLVVVFVHFSALSQKSSLQNDFENRFISELNLLDKEFQGLRVGTNTGNFDFNSAKNFGTEYKKTGKAVFSDLFPKANYYYHFLDELDIPHKQNLVRTFCFFEKDFEKALKKSGLSVELKFLAPTLSAMHSGAMGSKGKTGLWQLNHFHAVLNGLEVNKLVDERLNPYLSTEATIQQLRQNFKLYQSAEMAVLAYLTSNVQLRNAISRAGENAGTEEIFQFLPVYVRDFVAAFQAMKVFLALNSLKSQKQMLPQFESPDTVIISRQLHFQQIASVLSIPITELQHFNPQYKYAIVPGNIKASKLALPKGKWDDFVLWQDSIFNSYDSTLFQITVNKIEYPPEPHRQYVGESRKDMEIGGKTKVNYKIKSGDVLGVIAEKYNVRVSDLKYWNGINNERKIRAGQTLSIFVDKEKAEILAKTENENEIKKQSAQIVQKIQASSTFNVSENLKSKEKVEHVVKSGESPYTIAKKYTGVTPEEILEWNGISNARKIQIGQKLIVYLKK